MHPLSSNSFTLQDLGGGVDRGVEKKNKTAEQLSNGMYIHNVSTGSSSRRRLILICSGGRAILEVDGGNV